MNIKIDLRHERIKRGLSQARFAELTKIPQHVLSAAELGKLNLTDDHLLTIRSALKDDQRVKALTDRKKRYREHRYESVKRLEDRVSRAQPTPGNKEYVGLLKTISDGHNSPKKRKLRAISLFSGCGGFSLGFSAAGFQIAGFLELEDHLRDIYKCNFNSKELGSDITKINDETLRTFSKEIKNVDVIIGGPPCQGFSLSGKRRVDDPRNSLFRHYLRFVDAFNPKIAVLENVRLLTSMKSKAGVFVKDEITEAFKQHGYNIQHFEINAKDYGVPQHRERVIFVATRCDTKIQPTLPHAEFGQPKSLFAEARPYRTFGDACSDLAYIESGEGSSDPLHEAVKHPSHVIEWLWNVPEGSSAHDNVDIKLRPPSGYNTTYKRQIWSEPASTVQTTFGMISGCRNVHPIATRSLTIREAARIQSFPDEYVFCGNLGTIRTGIGNAVPPLLAYSIATHVRDIILSL